MGVVAKPRKFWNPGTPGQQMDRAQNIVQWTKGFVVAGKKTRPNLTADAIRQPDFPRAGSCIVQDAVPMGSGSVCNVELLSNGQPTGVKYVNAISPNAALTRGDVAQFNKELADQMVLVSGTGGTSTTTTGAAVMYPTQFFGVVEGGVKGVFDGS